MVNIKIESDNPEEMGILTALIFRDLRHRGLDYTYNKFNNEGKELLLGRHKRFRQTFNEKLNEMIDQLESDNGAAEVGYGLEPMNVEISFEQKDWLDDIEEPGILAGCAPEDE